MSHSLRRLVLHLPFRGLAGTVYARGGETGRETPPAPRRRRLEFGENLLGYWYSDHASVQYGLEGSDVKTQPGREPELHACRDSGHIMYEAFYGLKSRPFVAAPDPHFIFWSANHSLGLSMLRFGLMMRCPLSVITGEIGAGKTTLVRYLLNELPDDLEIGLISNMQSGRGELLHWILMALGRSFNDEPYVKLFHMFQEYLVEQYGQGRRVVLIIDEAQNCDMKTLEELRMLTNTNADQNDLIQIILVGQPQLRNLLADPALVQFSQRISCDFHLCSLEEADVGNYITHRLEIAGAIEKIFDEDTYSPIYAATRGVPRLINTLCDLCMSYGFSYERKGINAAIVNELLQDLEKRDIYQQFAPQSDVNELIAILPLRAAPQPKSG